MNQHRILLMAAALVLVACSDPAPPSAPLRNLDPERIARGAELFRRHCVVCHGAAAQGAENWRVRNADGTFLPPPLNGTGHAWHHPWADLKRTIQQGTAALGGNMPPWQGVLSEQDTEDVILWFQSLWSDEVYAAWWEIDRRQRHGRH
jgi:Cytochrome c, mono- and diheme variants